MVARSNNVSDAEIQISSLSNGIADVGRPVENARSLAKIQGLEWNAITRPHTPIFRSGSDYITSIGGMIRRRACC